MVNNVSTISALLESPYSEVSLCITESHIVQRDKRETRESGFARVCKGL